MQMKEHARLQHLKKLMDSHEEPAPKEEQTWSWRKLLNPMVGMEIENKKRDDRGTSNKGKGKTPDSYNLYDRHPDFSNDYGWSVALDKHDFSPLKHSGIGIYLVNLTAVTNFFCFSCLKTLFITKTIYISCFLLHFIQSNLTCIWLPSYHVTYKRHRIHLAGTRDMAIPYGLYFRFSIKFIQLSGGCGCIGPPNPT